MSWQVLKKKKANYNVRNGGTARGPDSMNKFTLVFFSTDSRNVYRGLKAELTYRPAL